MRCPGCSAQCSEADSFCQSCGARLAAACGNCGHLNAVNARYCGACGASLGAIEGERKLATVLFADIVGSTQLITSLDPEQSLERLQPAVAEMCAIAQRFEAAVSPAGDGVLAVFGAPRAQEGHALLACEAALAMQAAIPRAELGLSIRIGLHSGSIVSAVLPSHPGQEPGAYGLTVHLAHRVQEIAQPNKIYLTDACYRLVRAYCDVRPLGPQPLKSVQGSIDIYELLRLKPAAASAQFRRANLSSFRGRDHELESLKQALRRAEASDPEVIGISGAAGLGKSRLCFEFAEWCRERHIPVLEMRSQIYGHATPLQPVLEFLRLLFRVRAEENAQAARERIAAHVLAIAPTFKADLPLLFEFLGLASPDDVPSRLSPKARHGRLLDVIRHLVRHGGAVTNVIILEDLHWLDQASEEFVTTLVEAVAGSRTMLAVNFRPSYSAPWMAWPVYRQLSLAELSPFQTQALAGELLGASNELFDIRRRVAESSGGNPFFAEELVRSLLDNGVVAGGAGAYVLKDGASEIPLPPTVEGVIGARIDRLTDDEKTALQAAAIIGKEFPLAVLRDVVPALRSELAALLRRLCQAELIQELPSGDGQFAFHHPLIQEVAYSRQLKSRRRAMHAAVARAMERYFPGRIDEFAGLLAHHYESAGQLQEAAAYAARAAMWVGATNPAQAIRHWEHARSLLQTEAHTAANDRLRIMAAGQIAWLGWREGMTAEAAQPLIAEALQLARESDRTMVPMLLFVDGRITVASGGPADLYVERVKEALSLLEGTGRAGRIATLNCALSQAYGWAGLLNQALAASDAALAGVSHIEHADHRFLGYNVEHWVHSLRGRILVRQARLAEAVQCFEAILRIEESLVDPTLQFIPHLGYVDLAFYTGDAELAERHARRVGEIADTTGSAYVRVYAFACAGAAKLIAGDLQDAARELAKGLQFVRKATASMGYEPEIVASLADCHYRLGDAERAIAFAEEAIAGARLRTTRLPECRASIVLGEALLRARGASARPQAVQLFQRAAEMIELTGARIYAPLLQRARNSTLVVAP